MLVGSGIGFTYEPGWRWPAPGEPFTELVEDGGTAKVFFLQYANFGADDSLIWPFGSSGFSINTLRVF